MISSFFSKTKPINYLVILGFISILYAISVFFFDKTVLYGLAFLPKLVTLTFLILSIFFVTPILKRNKLAELSSFTMLFYTLLVAAFLPVTENDLVVISNFFVLLSTDKVLSLKEEKRTINKIYEASLLVFISSFLNEWTLLFLLPIYMAIYAYCGSQLRNWLMPIAAFATITLIIFAYTRLFQIEGFLIDHYQFSTPTTFSIADYYGIGIHIVLTLVITIIVLLKLGNGGMGRILSLRILSSYFVFGILIAFLSLDIDAVMYSFFATAILFSNYFETINRKWLKESFLTLLLIVPLVLVFIYLLQ